ncbi:MAG TPA: hypothetical protein VJN89_09680 [Candidatus Acidoferrum sp.]|nr:hypothetical protein [Candidatus Acidoferrum sp.]
MHSRQLGIAISLVLGLSLAVSLKSLTHENKPDLAGASRAPSGSALEAAQHFTAKAVLAKARGKALAWQSDVALEEVDTDYAGPQGKIPVSADPNLAGVTRWEFVFSSAKTKTALLVLTDGGQYLGTQDVPKARTTFGPLPEDFVDSDVAMAEAKKNGFAASADGNEMCLARAYVFISSGPTPQRFPEPVWIVGLQGDQFIVSAKTGKFLSRHK